MQIRNIIFDLGGVLLDINYQLTQKAFEDLGCTNFHAIYSKSKQTTLFDDFETGRISESSFFEEIKKLSSLDNCTTQALMDAWNSMLIGFPEKHFSMLQSIKTTHRIFLLSNTNETHIRGFIKIMEQGCGFSRFENLFEKAYYSSRLGMRKPDANCFLHVLKENNLNASETIFIDDSIQHVEGASKTGIQAHWLKQPLMTENLLKDLRLLQ